MRPLSLIGKSTGWIKALGDDGREKWIISTAFSIRPNCEVDKIFQLHAPQLWEYWMPEHKSQMVIAWNKPGFETCERLPYEALLDLFGPIFASTISWMLAYAMFLEYTDIGIYGIDMTAGEEYSDQREPLIYLIGMARERGINIRIPEYSGIYMPPQIYGVPEVNE